MKWRNERNEKGLRIGGRVVGVDVPVSLLDFILSSFGLDAERVV